MFSFQFPGIALGATALVVTTFTTAPPAHASLCSDYIRSYQKHSDIDHPFNRAFGPRFAEEIPHLRSLNESLERERDEFESWHANESKVLYDLKSQIPSQEWDTAFLKLHNEYKKRLKNGLRKTMTFISYIHEYQTQCLKHGHLNNLIQPQGEWPNVYTPE
ncbi:MAG: hypothetical protein WAZ18_06310 [Alphaproteobacteria bacterium]